MQIHLRVMPATGLLVLAVSLGAQEPIAPGVTVTEMVARVVHTSGFNYWESGMDLRLGQDLFDSFVEYQGRLLAALDIMAGEYRFAVVDTSASVEEWQTT